MSFSRETSTIKTIMIITSWEGRGLPQGGTALQLQSQHGKAGRLRVGQAKQLPRTVANNTHPVCYFPYHLCFAHYSYATLVTQVAVGNYFFPPSRTRGHLWSERGQNFVSAQQNTRGKDNLFINFRRNWDMQKAITLLKYRQGTKANILLLPNVP